MKARTVAAKRRAKRAIPGAIPGVSDPASITPRQPSGRKRTLGEGQRAAEEKRLADERLTPVIRARCRVAGIRPTVAAMEAMRQAISTTQIDRLHRRGVISETEARAAKRFGELRHAYRLAIDTPDVKLSSLGKGVGGGEMPDNPEIIRRYREIESLPRLKSRLIFGQIVAVTEDRAHTNDLALKALRAGLVVLAAHFGMISGEEYRK